MPQNKNKPTQIGPAAPGNKTGHLAWIIDELNRARAEGWEMLTLGSRTLRSDATPIVSVSVLLHVWGEL